MNLINYLLTTNKKNFMLRSKNERMKLALIQIAVVKIMAMSEA